MGKVLGIIAEYNPFHNGHLYHLEQAKKLTGSSYTVAVISGNFTQRGSTALIDKWFLLCMLHLVLKILQMEL